ncbi:endonuclease III [Candidatus Woesearchaeota archaeon]|nr:endonuclease III [Candidatus Woesearchaeota archaeon]
MQIDNIYRILEKEVVSYKSPIIDLMRARGNSPFRILIATILSARTKDETTSKVVSKLFLKVKDFKDLEKIDVKELEKLIYPVGFYKNKAKQLKKLPIVIKKEFNGKIPENIDDLVKLPGVGRKTANLVMTAAFGKYGITVDTHVFRIMNRIGYVKTKNPLETEMVLRRRLPKKYWKNINYFLVSLGQNVCTPISPYCSKCPVREYCKRVGVKSKR